MKKNYQTPELEHVTLESEPVAAGLGIASNIFGMVDESDLPEVKEM